MFLSSNIFIYVFFQSSIVSPFRISSFSYTNLGHKSDSCYSVQTVFLHPNYTENMDKMDVSVLKIGQSHTKRQNIPLRCVGKIPSSPRKAAPPTSYCVQ